MVHKLHLRSRGPRPKRRDRRIPLDRRRSAQQHNRQVRDGHECEFEEEVSVEGGGRDGYQIWGSGYGLSGIAKGE